jgi:hypothetical protein
MRAADYQGNAARNSRVLKLAHRTPVLCSEAAAPQHDRVGLQSKFVMALRRFLATLQRL